MERLGYSIKTAVGYFLIVTAISSPLFAGIVQVAPEIDGGLLGSAVALVVGGYLVVVSRARRR